MHEHASKVRGSGAAQRDANEAPVGKQTLVEHLAVAGTHAGAAGPHASAAGEHKSEGERIADSGERLLDGVAEVLQKLADMLTDYNDAGAEAGKERLAHILKTCKEGSVDMAHEIQPQADLVTNFHFAKLMRAAANQARNMAKASGELSKQLHEHKKDAILVFLTKAFFSAVEMLLEFQQFSLEVGTVNSIVAQIGTKCGHKVKLDVPKALKPHVLKRPSFQFHVNPQLSPDGRVVTIPGLTIPGGHTVLPHGLSVPHGPVIGQYVA